MLVEDGKGGKRLVERGNQVKLLPVELREQDEEDGDFFTQQEYERLHSQLCGDGPFVVFSMGEWPCGRTMLYLKSIDGRDLGGYYASDFMCAEG